MVKIASCTVEKGCGQGPPPAQDSVDSREVLGCAGELGGLKNLPQMTGKGTPHGPHKGMDQRWMMMVIHTSDGNTAFDIEGYRGPGPGAEDIHIQMCKPCTHKEDK